MNNKRKHLQFEDAEPAVKATKPPVEPDPGKVKQRKKAQVHRAAAERAAKKEPKLRFDEPEKPQSKLNHAAKVVPGQMVTAVTHRAMHQDESENGNAGAESADKMVSAAEGGTRLVQENLYTARLRHRRNAAATAEQANTNPLSRLQQKRAIKRRYAAAVQGGQPVGTAQTAQRIGSAAVETGKKASAFFVKNKKVFGIIGAVLLLMAMLMNTLSSCSVLFSGIGSAVAGSTYPAQDSAMLDAEAAYTALETDLQYELDNYATLHTGYDEYRYDLDAIGHDPYVLISMLTALYGGEWTLAEAQPTIEMLFGRQYTLTETVVTEVRTRPVPLPPPAVGTYDEPYDYKICTVTLDNFDLSHLPVYLMSEEQLSVYATYMATLGNRTDLFPQGSYPNASQLTNYTDYDIPADALSDPEFAAMIAVAEQYLGYPYIWGGSSPNTSFDCSGFVSWVVNHSGWNVGRQSAQGLCNLSTPVSADTVQPGDLVFFVGTYDTPGVSHCGIYVGNGMMLHCGSPISYTNLNDSYWQSHFYTYGRLP